MSFFTTYIGKDKSLKKYIRLLKTWGMVTPAHPSTEGVIRVRPSSRGKVNIGLILQFHAWEVILQIYLDM